jgi:hypothetical protein
MGAGFRLSARLQHGATVASAANLRPIGPADTDRESHALVITRDELFSALYLVCIANAFAAIILAAMGSDDPYQGLAEALNVGTLAAPVVGIHLLRQMPDAAVTRGDWLVAAVAAGLLLVPHRSGTWLAMTGLAFYALARDRRSIPAVAAGSVFLALAASSFWGPVLVQALGAPLLAVDAVLAAGWLRVLGSGDIAQVGNLVVTSDQTTLLVLAGCSFLPNLLYGVLLWTVVARALRPEWRRTDLLALLAVGTLVVTANSLRLALIGLSAPAYEWAHGPVGGNVFNIALLLLIAAIALYATGPAASPARR